ncbi:gephyrin-like molybdotransferase Glp [Aestuariibacter sp. A3R04]|uniref:molybdopterin molybdotransferase MoeA n=1 Tax=Aestuariibacter sp. A3R04 TaxID=2841571 RepID=UPI001C0A0CA5|nr:gephyrin-like molybdotransferase Glp [Aestuariibacter sp. A3R04]MBU3022779.1 molybdopterin molybdotransferase MoeA [Aestuariibacter sp. A3R04]
MAQTPSPWLSLDDALAFSLSNVSPLDETVSLPVASSLGFVLADDLISPVNVPPADNSAMDGYAVYASDTQSPSPLTVVAEQFAGMSRPDKKQEKGTAIRIMTGALIPPGADSVVMQENTVRDATQVVIAKPALVGENIRRSGADIEMGSTVITKGTALNAAHLVLLHSMGISHVTVTRPLKVGILATGDELVEPGNTLSSGQIYESNRIGTRALLAQLPVTITDYGIVADDKKALSDILTKASKEQDLLISSGGVSVGDADFVKELVAQLGEINFWKVAIKPGKPFAFGKLSSTVFCGLPGNPVSAFVTAQQLVLPIIRRMAGIATQHNTTTLTLTARLQQDIKRRKGRQEFLRARMYQDSDQQWCVAPLSKQSSGVMTSITNANCYLVLPAEVSEVKAGDTVLVQPLRLNDHWAGQ